MARPLKDGLEYYSHDVGMSSDPKILCLEAEHGLKGYAVYNKLLEMIYASSDGEIDIAQEINEKVLANKFGISLKIFQKILKSCINFKLFDENLYNSEKVLTSNGIKKRFSIVKDERERKRIWKARHSKLDTKDDNSSDEVDDDNNGTSNNSNGIRQDSRQGYSNENTHSKVNESKVNESKAYNNTTNVEGQAPLFKSLIDLKSELDLTKNKVGFLGNIFRDLHKTCPKEDTEVSFGRIGKLVKQFSNDYGYILTAIYKTQDGMVSIDGSHLSYIEGLLRNNGHKSIVLKNSSNYSEKDLKGIEEIERLS